MPNWSNYMKGILSVSLPLIYLFLLDPAVQLIKSSFFITVVDLERGYKKKILQYSAFFPEPSSLRFVLFFSKPGGERDSEPLSCVPPRCLPCNQRPLLLNYGVWIWALWWPSRGDPTTDLSIRVQPSPPLLCALHHIFFFHLWDLYEEGNERKRVTRVVFLHLPTSEAANRGSVFTLILCRVHLRFKGWRAGSITLL